MCERCGTGFAFLGQAEPQPALLDPYLAALRAGWQPSQSAQATDLMRAAETGAAAFLAERADQVDAPVREGGLTVGRRIRLTRWLWDGEFCGEAHFVYVAPSDISVTASIVPWKANLGYRDRAIRHLLLEARDLGVPVADLDRAAQSGH